MLSENPSFVDAEHTSLEFQKFQEKEGFSSALGIIGGSNSEYLPAYKQLITEGCRLAQVKSGSFAIVSGGTHGGIPEMALDIGKNLGLPTIGVFPDKGAKYAALEKIDFPIAVPSPSLSEITWGVETPVLISLSDAFILVGGEWGTLTEVSMIMKKNISRAKSDLPPLPIIIIDGSGKLADNLEILTNFIPSSAGSLHTVHTPEELAYQLLQVLK